MVRSNDAGAIHCGLVRSRFSLVLRYSLLYSDMGFWVSRKRQASGLRSKALKGYAVFVAAIVFCLAVGGLAQLGGADGASGISMRSGDNSGQSVFHYFEIFATGKAGIGSGQTASDPFADIPARAILTLCRRLAVRAY